MKEASKEKYYNVASYRSSTRARTQNMYIDNSLRQNQLKKASARYQADNKYRETMKQKGVQKYMNNKTYRSKCLAKSVKKYPSILHIGR